MKALVLGADPDALDSERTAGAIDLARQFIARFGVSRRFYSFTEPLDGGWSMLREPDEPLADYECPFEPLGPDLPLSHYDDRFVVVLPDGAEVDRFGTADGNTVFVPGTTLPHRSMPPGQDPGECHRYRVTGGFEVVTGLIKSENGQVGGGQAYVLPQPVGELVAGGWLAEV